METYGTPCRMNQSVIGGSYVFSEGGFKLMKEKKILNTETCFHL